MWSMESMVHHKINRVIFASETSDLIGAMIMPQDWPSFGHHRSEIMLALRLFPVWNLHAEISVTNGGAFLIVQNVTREEQRQSYVAISSPSWLKHLFDGERVITSL